MNRVVGKKMHQRLLKNAVFVMEIVVRNSSNRKNAPMRSTSGQLNDSGPRCANEYNEKPLVEGRHVHV